ncbi:MULTISPECIES: DUF192 domain-containing protein [Marinobacter]|uniref:DUF192 domain-containing protein n=1 Tax=Marinobacter nauticus TaxID=2743 RepID=A0A455W518_MARNT|nr:DUF192 domain-containing protein [Marinobacter alkaliphilus]BBJ04021.1 hypothetical protein YBY_18700 [Marinobacter nauticus]
MSPFSAAVVATLITAGFAPAALADTLEPLPTVEACFATTDHKHAVVLEVASKNKQRQRGLMERTTLAEDAGMLFTYQTERSPNHGFWMYQTLIPLDIAYLDKQGVIVSIHTMTPCPSSEGRNCPTYPSGERFWNAVEMNAGFFEARGITAGDQLLWPAEQACQP